MIDQVTAQRWRFRTGFAAISLAVVAASLLPLGDGTSDLPGPDLPVVLVLAWVLRRPDFVPAALVAAVMLLSDFLQMRPPGLWAAIVVLGVEFLRSREATLRDLPFFGEWALASLVLFAMTLLHWLLLALFLVPHPGLGLLLLQYLATVAAYPVVVLASRHLLGLRKTAPGEVDALGHRL